MYGPQAAFITEQFDIHLRSTGASLAYTIAGVVGGAMAPLIFTWLLSQYDSWCRWSATSASPSLSPSPD